MDKEGSEVTDNTPLQEYFQVAFASKPAEKLDSWLKILLDEEYETVGSLRHASDEEWQEIQKLSLPLAIVGQLKRTLRVSPSEIKLPDAASTSCQTLVVPPSPQSEVASAVVDHVTKKQANSCEVCNAMVSKYTCPKCSLR